MRVLPPPLRAVSPSELAERLEAERSGEAFLLYLDCGARQRIVHLAGRVEPLSIGRTASNDIALEADDEVSRVHAMLEPVGSEWTVVDDGLSRNGTYVNGSRVRGRRRLVDGDAIGVGGMLILYAGTAEAGGDDAHHPPRGPARAVARPPAGAVRALPPAVRRSIRGTALEPRDRRPSWW